MPGRVKYRAAGMRMMISQAPIFTIHAELGDIRHFGQTPYGERRVIDILGGRIDGLRHGPPEVLAALARGETVDPARYYFRTLMRFETADPNLAWLNRILALGTGAREARAVRLDVHEVV